MLKFRARIERVNLRTLPARSVAVIRMRYWRWGSQPASARNRTRPLASTSPTSTPVPFTCKDTPPSPLPASATRRTTNRAGLGRAGLDIRTTGGARSGSVDARLSDGATSRASARHRPTRISPPLALERRFGAARFVQGVERRHRFVAQVEVEDPGVLLDALAVRRLRDHHQVALNAPAQ